MAERFTWAPGKGPWPSVKAAQDAADAERPNAFEVAIRGERTSDGTEWGPGLGRVVAVRRHKSWERY